MSATQHDVNDFSLPVPVVAAPTPSRSCELAPDDQASAFSSAVPVVTPVIIAASVDRPSRSTLLQNRWVILGLLAMTGPLSLPLVWLSPRFSLSFKTFTTIVYLFLTFVVPLAIAFYFLDIAMQPLLEAFHRKAR